MTELIDNVDRLLVTPPSDPQIIPIAKETLEALKKLAAESEDLRRYRETRARMGPPTKYTIAPQYMPYTIHST